MLSPILLCTKCDAYHAPARRLHVCRHGAPRRGKVAASHVCSTPSAQRPSMPKAAAHEVSDPPAIPTASKSHADAKGMSKRVTLLLSVAILGVATLGILSTLRHEAQLVQLSAKLEEQAAESTKLQRRMGRVAEKVTASNRSIKVLIEDLKEEKKELRQQVRQHHGKLDRLLARLVVFNGTVTARHRHGQGEKVLLMKKKEGSGDEEEEDEEEKDEEDEDGERPAKQNSTKSGKNKGKKSDADEEDDKEDDEDDGDEDTADGKKKGKKKGRGKKKKGRGR